MRKYGSEPFQAQTRWVAQHAAALNIPFLAHLGDVVDQQGKPDQWKVASAAMKVLEDAKVPYSILAGNHDVIMDRDYVDEQPEEWEGNRRAAGPGARTLSEELRPRPREAAGHVRRPRCQRLPRIPCVRSRRTEVHGAVAVVARVGRGAGMGQPGHPRQSHAARHPGQSPAAEHRQGRRLAAGSALRQDAVGKADPQERPDLHDAQRPLPRRGAADEDQRLRQSRRGNGGRLSDGLPGRQRPDAPVRIRPDPQRDQGPVLLALGAAKAQGNAERLRPGGADGAERAVHHQDGLRPALSGFNKTFKAGRHARLAGRAGARADPGQLHRPRHDRAEAGRRRRGLSQGRQHAGALALLRRRGRAAREGGRDRGRRDRCEPDPPRA